MLMSLQIMKGIITCHQVVLEFLTSWHHNTRNEQDQLDKWGFLGHSEGYSTFSCVPHRKHTVFQLKCFEFPWESSGCDKCGQLLSLNVISLKFVCPPKFIHGNLTPSVMVFGHGAFGEWSGLGVELMSGVGTLIKEAPERLFLPSM